MEMIMLVSGIILLILSVIVVTASITGHILVGLADGFLQVFYKTSIRNSKRENRELFLTALVCLTLFSLGIFLVKNSGSYKKTNGSNRPPVSDVR